MDQMKKLSLLLIVLTAGCGYVSSGKWENDERNWSRTFHSAKPEDVVVVHSLYWRAPHWSFEAGYLFEIEPNDSFRKQLFAEYRMRQIERSEFGENERPCFGKCPDWFAPNPLETYDVWTYDDDRRSNFRVFIDRNTGRIFFGEYQV